jgi:putative transposase
MPDHVHFFCRPEWDAQSDLSRFVGAWKEWTSKLLVRREGWIAPLWQPEFFDHLIRSDESLDEKWDYVCRNPERAGLVDQWVNWPYQGSLTEWTRVITK